jgi:hypothetical protein
MKFGSQLPDYFKRIHYTSDEQMVDGYKLVELFTQHNAASGLYDIRKLHTLFRVALTIDVVFMLLLVEEKKQQPLRNKGKAGGSVFVHHPGGLSLDPTKTRGAPTIKDAFERLEKLEGPLNDPQHQGTFFRPRHVVVMQCVRARVRACVRACVRVSIARVRSCMWLCACLPVCAHCVRECACARVRGRVRGHVCSLASTAQAGLVRPNSE